MISARPADHMAAALQLAERGRYTTFPNPRVGCVLVRDGIIIGRGWHEQAGQAHAEVMAIADAGWAAKDAEAYVTLEPCAHQGHTGPCVDALIGAGVRKVWAAMEDPNPLVAGRGIKRLREAGIEVEVGMLEAAARELNRGFVSRMERGRPFVTLKLAASLDGRTAMASGESKWISSEAARADVHRLRAEAGAVLSSSATVLADDPELNVRHMPTVGRQPDRIILDRWGKVPASARVWKSDGAIRWWVVGGKLLKIGEGTVEPSLGGDERPALAAVFALLAREQINSLLVECGPTLAGALLGEALVDELICYLSPCLLGSAARGLANVPGLEMLQDRVRLTFKEVRRIGPDLRITAIPG